MTALCGSSQSTSVSPVINRATPDEDRHREHEAEGSPNDQLDVHQPVLDHRVGQRERNQCERHVAGELHRQAGGAAEGEGQGVEGEEGDDTSARCPTPAT